MQPAALPPLVKAKLSPPKVEDACLRSDTIELLTTLFRRRVTLLCAPAGYGKTTVVLEAIRRLGLHSVWYKLDVLDQDPVVLIASLVEALARLHDGFGQTIRDRLANAYEVPYPVEQMTAAFVAEVTDDVDEELHVILDDYHEAADSPTLNATLDYLVVNLPANIRFVVLSRYEPAFGVGKLRLDGELGVVGVEQLRFGPDEVVEVMARRSGTCMPAARAEALADLTEGWPASVVLAAMAIPLVGVDALEDALADPRLRQDVFSYLAEQVYARETPEVKAFLRRTCCLDHVSADLAARVGAPRRAHRILAHLQANGVFTFATDQEGTFRYHSLFREFLRQKTVQEDGSDRFHRLQLDTAAALEATGDVETAVDLCLVANEPRRALDVVARAGEKNLDAFRSDTLDSWLERLPEQIKHNEPWARLLMGQVHMRAGRFDEALRHQAAAAERFESTSDRRGLYQALSAQERTLYWQGKTGAAAEACRLALDVADTDEQRVHTLISLGAALQSECRWLEAEEALTEARSLAESSFPAERARLEARSVYAALTAGRYRLAARGSEVSRRLVLDHGSPSLQAAFLNMIGTAWLFLADWTAARRFLQAARELNRRFDYLFLDALLDDAEGQLCAAIGDSQGVAHLRPAALSAQSLVDDAYGRSMALCHAGTEMRRSGDANNAIGWYAKAMAAAENSAAHFAYLNASANYAFCSRRESAAATAVLADTSRRARDLDLLSVALKADFFAAVLLYRDGDRSEALDGFAQCIPQQLELGHLNFLVQELVLEPEMALDFMHTRAEPDVAQALIELFARHWNGLSLLVSCLALDPVSGVAAVNAGVDQRNDAEVASILAKATRSPFPEVRRAAAARRRRRKAAPGATSREDVDLTPRERQILAMMADGALNADIARELVLSPATVKTHVNHIFTKLGAKDRVQAVLRYRKAPAAAPASAPTSTPKALKPPQDTTVG